MDICKRCHLIMVSHLLVARKQNIEAKERQFRKIIKKQLLLGDFEPPKDSMIRIKIGSSLSLSYTCAFVSYWLRLLPRRVKWKEKVKTRKITTEAIFNLFYRSKITFETLKKTSLGKNLENPTVVVHISASVVREFGKAATNMIRKWKLPKALNIAKLSLFGLFHNIEYVFHQIIKKLGKDLSTKSFVLIYAECVAKKMNRRAKERNNTGKNTMGYT